MRTKRQLVLTAGASLLIAVAGFLGACNDDDNDDDTDLGQEIEDVGDAIGDEIDDVFDEATPTPTLAPSSHMQPADSGFDPFV
jgi:hypothetical protein